MSLPPRGSLGPPKLPTASHEWYHTGIPHAGHLQVARAVNAHPFDTEHDVALEFEFVLEDVAANSKDAEKKRTDAIGWLKLQAKNVVPINARIRAAMPDRTYAIDASFNIGLLLVLNSWAAWPGVTLATSKATLR